MIDEENQEEDYILNIISNQTNFLDISNMTKINSKYTH